MSDELGAPIATPELAPASEAPAPDQITPPTPEPNADAKREPKTIADALKSARAKVETQQATGERQRDEQGRFTPSKTDNTPPAPKPPTAKADALADPAKPAQTFDPPSRFTPDAKAAWATVPDPVKAEINRAVRELESGLQQYQQRFEPLKPYFQMAEQYGTTVHEAMERYTSLEMALSQNPDAAISEIFRYANINPHEWAAKILNMQPDMAATQYQNTISALQNEILSMKQQLQQFNGHIQSQEEQRMMAEINQFKAAHPRFDELREEMVRMLETGYAANLEDAYSRADRLNPAPAQPPAMLAQPAPQPQQPKRTVQVSGAPSAGSNPAMRKPSSSIQESLRRAASMTGVRG